MSAYSIVDIPGWENLSLNNADRTELEARLSALAHQAVPDDVPRDSATPFRLELHKHLSRVVEHARSAGAGLICLPTRRMGDIAVPASYTVSEWRDGEGGATTPETVLNALAANSSSVTRLVDIDGQPALREEGVEPANPTADPLSRHAVRRVTYTVSSPTDDRAWLVFTFVTLGSADPTGPLADVLVELFDAQLTTVRWGEQ
ncbi:hypothetical protein ELQ92_02775 [Labedella populi]|uniref:Uncharacterized protein n=1 Tax=Labedella populi TaxID=2498850 RepID=A0A3S4BDL6_9MICO|nr:hypothetical protein [Labedella populi]RWZ68177.1 hypothetical protein ELQ92_02775 [Labedella populi]